MGVACVERQHLAAVVPPFFSSDSTYERSVNVTGKGYCCVQPPHARSLSAACEAVARGTLTVRVRGIPRVRKSETTSESEEEDR